MPSPGVTVGELIEAGYSIVAEIRQSGRPKDGGVLVEEQFWFVCTFLDGCWGWDGLQT